MANVTRYALHKPMKHYCPLVLAVFVLSLLRKKRYLSFGKIKKHGFSTMTSSNSGLFAAQRNSVVP